MSVINTASSAATARGQRGVPMTDPNATDKAAKARKRARATAKASRKEAAAKRREEQERARQARAARKAAKAEAKALAKAARKVATPAPVEVTPQGTVTERHREELRALGWLRERPSRAHTQEWVNSITPEEDIYEDYYDSDLVDKSEGVLPPNAINWGIFEAEAKKIAKVAEELERKLKAHTKWLQRELGWQQMLVFVKAKYGVDLADLTCEEWESKRLSPERVKSLGLRSPKLSKAMVALGIPQKEVAVLLGATYTKNPVSFAATQVLTDESSCKEQGNSIHYSSCQATDSRSLWGGNGSYNRVYKDLCYMGKSLFLWVVGEPMSKDGKGFEARAKLRVMYADRKCEQVAGLYIDRPYGKHQMLLDNLDELQAWWSNWCEVRGCGVQPILMPPVWNRDNGAGNDFQYAYGGRYSRKLYCPSAEGGYQDTLTQGLGGYDCFVDVTAQNKSLLLKAYTKRSKFGGVYYSPLTDVVYNPQKGEVMSPTVSLPQARKPISEAYRTLYKECRKRYGATSFEEVGDNYFFYKEEARFELWVTPLNKRITTIVDPQSHDVILSLAVPGCGSAASEVMKDCPELGMYAPVPLPVSVYEESRFYGWMKRLEVTHRVEGLYEPALPLDRCKVLVALHKKLFPALTPVCEWEPKNWNFLKVEGQYLTVDPNMSVVYLENDQGHCVKTLVKGWSEVKALLD